MDETVRLVHRVISWRCTVGFKNISSDLVHRHSMLVATASPARTALKISQLIRQPPDGVLPTNDSMHRSLKLRSRSLASPLERR